MQFWYRDAAVVSVLLYESTQPLSLLQQSLPSGFWEDFEDFEAQFHV